MTIRAPDPEQVKDLVDQVVDQVWNGYVGLGAVPSDGPGPALREAIAGQVSIAGSWRGRLIVTCEPELARRAGAALLGVEPSSPGELLDTLGEVTNITGGNLMGLLPGLPTMSLPSVGPASAEAGRQPDWLFTYACGDQAFTVALIADHEEDHRAHPDR